MARLVTCGFEQQQSSSTRNTIEGAGINGTWTVETSTVRSGAASAKLTQTKYYTHRPQQTGTSNDYTGLAKGRTYYDRAYVRIAAAPNTDFEFYSSLGYDSAFHGFCSATLKTDRTLQLYVGATATGDRGATIGSASSALALDTWYRIEFAVYVPTSGTGTVTAKIDGVDFVTAGTTASTSCNYLQSCWGDLNATTSSMTVYLDDVALNDDQGSDQNSWPGSGKVVLLKPTGDSSITGWTDGDGSGTLFGSLDNTPPTGVGTPADGTQIKDSANNATDNADFTLQTYTVGGLLATDTIKAVQSVAQVGNSTTTSRNVCVRVTSNPTDSGETNIATTSGSAVGTSPAGWLTGRGVVTYSPSVTLGTGPVLRIGKRTATTDTVQADFAGLLVEYVDSGARTTSDSWAWSETATGAVSTRTQKWQGGRFYAHDGSSDTYADSSKRLTEHGTATAAGSIGGVTYLADSGSGYTSYTLTGPAASNNGQTNVTVDDDFAVSLDAGSYHSNSAASINVLLYQDANNWYRLEVAKTAGGTSTLYKKVSGSESSVATVSKGVAASSMARVQVYRNGSSSLGIVVDGSSATYSDPSPLSGPFTVYLGAPATTGMSNNHVDNIEVCYGTKVRVLGCPTGGGAAIYDSGGSLVTSASESSGIATLDLAGQQFPFTGYVQVCTSLSPVTPRGNGRFPYSGTTSLYGGDDFYYDPATSTGLSGLKSLTATAEATYSTTQTGSHNGVVVNGTTTYGVTLGFNGKVIAFSYNSDTGEYSENEIGSQSDMHSTCDVQADSSGILHFVYGGSTHTQQTTKYRKSNTAWSITDLATETDLGERIRASLLVDSSDNLYLVGSRSNAASYDQMVCKKRSGGSWQSTVVIANADASWQLYPCDATLGRDGKIHGMWMAYSSGTGFEHAFHAKSTDGSTWTGITGTSLSLPLSQNSGTGKLSNSATLAADGDYGVSRLTVDSDGTVHAVIGRNSSTYAYFQGSSSTGWPASPTYTFTGTVYSNHGVIERFGNYLVYVIPSPVSGPSSSLYQTLTRWLSQDNGATWNTSTLFTNPTGGRAHFWWPKLTPITGSAYAKALWQGRGSVYSNMDGNSPLSGYGQSTLYLADVSVVLDVAAADSWAWSDTPSRQVAESRTAADTWAWSDSASQVLGHSSSTGTRTAADSWAWTDTAAGPRVTPATYPRTAADIWLWQDQVSRPVTPSPPEDPGYRLTFDIGPYL